MNEDTKCVHCEVLTRQRDSVQKDVDYLTGLLERVRIDRNKALVRVTELVAELNEFRTADDDYNAHAKHYAKKCAALRKELEQCKTPESPEAEAERERKAMIADRLGVPPGGFLAPHVLKALDELEHLRKAHSEADNSAKNMYNANVVLSKEIHSVRLELAALRERASVDTPADQVEALARVLYNTIPHEGGTTFETERGASHYYSQARAAIAHLRPTQGHVLRDRLVEAEAKIERQRAELARLNAMVAELRAQPSGNTGQLPEDQVEALARVLEEATAEGFEEEHRTYMRRLARAAIAHLNTRPEGLPTAEELLDRWTEFSVSEDTKEQFYLTALRPWLRDPVGYELDVTTAEAEKAYEDARGHRTRNMDAVLDLCRSRIRPVFECKECAGWQIAHNDIAIKLNAARAALEGE